MRLEKRIRQEIRQRGMISVGDYMAYALADETDGYYMHKDPLGIAGDFITAPEISQIFGELVGIWCAETWQGLGAPAIDLIELGPGRGTLMQDMLRATQHVAGFHDAIDVHLVEMSPILTRMQQETLKDKHARIQWHTEMPSGEKPAIIVANEFFDALPIRQFFTVPGGFAERMVTLVGDDTFCFAKAKEVLPALPGDFPAIKADTLEYDNLIELCPLAQGIMYDISRRIATRKGALLAVDYGYARSAEKVATGDTLQAVRGHQFHDVLTDPGKADITAHVDFATLSDIAYSAGAQPSQIINQRDFLLRMGGKLRMEQLCKTARDEQVREGVRAAFNRLIDTNEMGDLFKVLAVTPPHIPAPIFG